MEFRKTIFQAWKVMENSKGHGKVMENQCWKSGGTLGHCWQQVIVDNRSVLTTGQCWPQVSVDHRSVLTTTGQCWPLLVSVDHYWSVLTTTGQCWPLLVSWPVLSYSVGCCVVSDWDSLSSVCVENLARYLTTLCCIIEDCDCFISFI